MDTIKHNHTTSQADRMRAAIDKTVQSFNDENMPATGKATFDAVKDCYDNDVIMARLWDICERGFDRDEAIAAIEAGAV